MEPLSPPELQRYARHLTLPEVGVEGQQRLKRASVLIVGAGGLGSPLALYLAAAGVGRLGLADFDRVDEGNLQRQVLYGSADLGRPKTAAARERLADLNPFLELTLHDARLDAGNAMQAIDGYDLVVDGTDNFPTRYLMNDACILAGKPNVYGSIFRFEGQVSVFGHAGGPCYRCLYPEPPPPGMVPNCAEGGVLGILPGVIGTLQATEAIKLILGRGESLAGRLLLFDALEMRFRELRLRRDPGCALCGDEPTIRELVDYEAFCGIVAEPDEDLITAPALKQRIDAGEPPLLLDVREPVEWAAGHLPGALHIPMRQLPQQADSLPRDSEIVVYCKSGARSLQVLRWLREAGFRNVRNLQGGLDRWNASIES